MTERGEPPEGLRDRDGWHWLGCADGSPGQIIAQWIDRFCWRLNGHGIPAEQMWNDGWRYVAPCATPAEVAALTAERDDYKQRWNAIQRELVGETGASAILMASTLRAERDAARAQAEALAGAVAPISEVITAADNYAGVGIDSNYFRFRIKGVSAEQWRAISTALAAYRLTNPEEPR